MKIKTILISALVLCTGASCKKSQLDNNDAIHTAGEKKEASRAIQGEAPLTWQEHWFEHNQLLDRVYSDSILAVYYDKDVDRKITWPNTFLFQAWRYTRKNYGDFGPDLRLYAIFHTGKYDGAHASTWMDGSHDYRSVIDCGSNSKTAWTAGAGNDLDISSSAIGKIVENSSWITHGSPAGNIWHDKWTEIYTYDLYQGLGRTADAERWSTLESAKNSNYPRAQTQWFKNWWLPIYNQYGKTAILRNFYVLLMRNFPTKFVNNGKQNILEYSRNMNFGEFVHFWSGAAGVDLKSLALTAFGNKDEQGNDWTVQLEQAQVDFPEISYSFNTKPPFGLTIKLKGFNNQFVSSENGLYPMQCNRPEASDWEKFIIVDAGGGKVALASSNFKFVSSENGLKPITCDRSVVSDWEKFDWVPTADGKIMLRGNNGKYISSENGEQAMTCTRDTPSGWESFTISQ